MAIGPVTPSYSPAYLKALADFGNGLTAPVTASSSSSSTAATASTNSSPTTSSAYVPSAETAASILGANSSISNAYVSLLSSTGSAQSNTSNGFYSAMNLGTNLALTAYSNHLNGLLNGTATTIANASSQASSSPSAGAQSSTQSAIQAAQSSVLASTLNLFA